MSTEKAPYITVMDNKECPIAIALTHYQALDLLSVLAQTPIAFFDDEESAEDMHELHRLLKRALNEIPR